MARKKPTTPSAPSKLVHDRTLYTHNLWLNYLKPRSLGLVVSPNALRAAQVELPLNSPDAQAALEALTISVQPDAPDLDLLDAPPVRHLADSHAFLSQFLGWKPHLLDFYQPSDSVQMYDGQRSTLESTKLAAPLASGPGVPVPEALCHRLAQFDEEALEPSFAYRLPAPPDPARPWVVLGLEVPAHIDLDRRPVDSSSMGWVESPQKKFERLLYETEIPIGLILHASGLRLIYRPGTEQSGYITFPLEALLKPPGRLACTALQELLKHARFHGLPSRQLLPHILAESRKYQNEVSTQLAEQVLAALFALLKGFESADEESKRRLLAGYRDDPRHTPKIYEGLLTVLMRLVFLLYAEEREMLPDDPLFANNYSLAGLFNRLVEDEARHPDTMDQRFGAWAHLIALFRVIHDGVEYDDPRGSDFPPVKIPKRLGSLFDPDRFPFLEGRSSGQPTSSLQLPAVPDATVLTVLRNLLYLQDERLSYRTLEVEQIGSVYEAIMGFQVETARGRSVAIRPEKRNGAPVTINLDELLAKSPAQRGKWFKDQTDRKLTPAAGAAVKNAASESELVAALGRLIDERLTPSPVPAGSLVFQPSPERRRSGSHYTPRALTEPIVSKAFEPVWNRLLATAPSPDSPHDPRHPTPDAILALKVCDPAMGSGAFLVEAMRWLARRLVTAWEVHGNPHRVPADETPFLFACRLVAQRCLYGVDKNPMAVDLARMSLWLATLAKDHEFTFLDHNFCQGDSLVGLSLDQVEACHWQPVQQEEFVTPKLRHRLATVMDRRDQILNANDLVTYERLNDIRLSAEEPLDFVRFLGGALVGSFFEGGTTAARETRRKDLARPIGEYLDDSLNLETRLVIRSEIDVSARVLKRFTPPLAPFHWEIEFPEVFLERDPRGVLRRKPDAGFDVIVGNPPFAGKNTIAEGHPASYLDWLKTVHEQSHGNADLVAHFFRRAFGLLRPGGSFGLIATNTIGQGDTRSTGLRHLCTHGGTIHAARKRMKWPGDAAVVVSVVHVHRGPLPGPFQLDGRPVDRITAYLFHRGGHDDPERLHANAGKSFVGSYVLGMGFTFDDTDTKGEASPITRARADELARSGDRPLSMEELIERDPRNQERIFPYIGGKEVNDSPTHAHHRYVINFGQMSEEEARQWPDLMKILEQRVKPGRLAQNREVRARYWWRFGEPAPALYASIRGFDRLLAISRVGERAAFAFLPNPMVYSEQLIVFATDRHAAFTLLQSRPHELWARFLGSTLEDRLRYTPSDCFETFPFPPDWESSADLEAAGHEYYEFRARLMVESNLGLTKTYNRFHDPREKSPEIRRLRELHAAMDRAVLNAYGWTDFDPPCGFDLDWCDADPADDASPDTLDRLDSGRFFFDTPADALAFASELSGSGKSLPWRYRWAPHHRDDLLARLLLLNTERATHERTHGLSPLQPLPPEDNPDDPLESDDPDDSAD